MRNDFDFTAIGIVDEDARFANEVSMELVNFDVEDGFRSKPVMAENRASSGFMSVPSSLVSFQRASMFDGGSMCIATTSRIFLDVVRRQCWMLGIHAIVIPVYFFETRQHLNVDRFSLLGAILDLDGAGVERLAVAAICS